MKSYDIAVIGAGPAGMTAAIYAARAGKQVAIFEGEACGGQIVRSPRVENYPGAPDIDGYELADRMLTQVRAVGAELISARVTALQGNEGAFTISTDREVYAAGRLVVATGVSHRKLGLAGEEALIGRGISFCATCDGMFFRRRRVAVVGGGNTAVQDALVLSEFCEKVYLIHRRAAFRAEANLVGRMRAKENIECITDTVVDALIGEGRLEGVVLRHLPSGEARNLEIAGLFEAVGSLPQTALLSGFVELDSEGYVLTDDDCRTSRPGVYAAGDCRRKHVRQLTTAVSDGTLASLAATEN